MSNSLEPADNPPPKPGAPTPDALPPVEPPSAAFLLQLFVIPLVIVTIIVMVWLMFSWLAHMGSNPRELVRDLKKLNDSSWQRALTLADLLRNPDYDYLKEDREMGRELAAVLESQIAAGSTEEAAIKLRVFLCKALGEFRVAEVLPALLHAATEERATIEIDVRRAALQALAVFVSNNDVDQFSARSDIYRVLEDGSRDRSAGGADKPLRDELRSTAVFALGVFGGPEALNRLEFMLADSYPNARYNAALGLARHGDTRSLTVLVEMLDPDNEESARGEQNESSRTSKRLMVIKNGIAGAGLLAERGQTADLARLQQALEKIMQSDLKLFDSRVHRGIRINAEEVLIKVKARRAGAQAR